jgi:hypothetical protein
VFYRKFGVISFRDGCSSTRGGSSAGLVPGVRGRIRLLHFLDPVTVTFSWLSISPLRLELRVCWYPTCWQQLCYCSALWALFDHLWCVICSQSIDYRRRPVCGIPGVLAPGHLTCIGSLFCHVSHTTLLAFRK